MKNRRIIVGVSSLIVALLGRGLALADDSAELIKQLQEQIQELDRKVKALERNRQIDQETATTHAKEAPGISIGENGFAVGTADGNFQLRLKGVLQADSRTFFHDHGIAGNDGFLLRRARPVIEGTVFRSFDFQFVPDFGGSSVQIFDAWLNYRFKPGLQLEVGKFKSPIGLEKLVADSDLLFNERSLATDLVPDRDVGVMLHGDLFDNVFSYGIGIFNGVGDLRNTTNASFKDDKDVEGRVFLHPFGKLNIPALKGLGVGVAGSCGKAQTANGLPNAPVGGLPGYTTDGQQQFFAYNPATPGAVVSASGLHRRVSPQGCYYWGPLGILGEYVISDQAVSRIGAAPLTSTRLNNQAWEITGSWILTGEHAAYKGPVAPNKPFNPGEGGWGAWQVVARYAALEIDSAAFPLFANPATSSRSAGAWAVGLNWWLNRNVRVMTSFSHTTFSFSSGTGTPAAPAMPGTVSRQPENVLFTRVQLAF
jgi:phosphate-selective porin OprO/OprP